MTSEHYKPPTWKIVLAWAAIIFGVLVILGGFAGGGTLRVLGGLFLGAAIILPGGWWLFCEKQDKTAREEAEDRVAMWANLTLDERTLLGDPEPAEVKNRRWPLIAGISILLLLIGGALSPASESNKNEDSEPAVSSSTSATATRTVKVTTSKATEASKAAEETTASARESEEPKAEPREERRATNNSDNRADSKKVSVERRAPQEARAGGDAEQPVEEQYAAEEPDDLVPEKQAPAVEETVQPAPVEEPAPVDPPAKEEAPAPTPEAPVVVEPAAPVVPPADVRYANCDEVRAAGVAPIPAGAPGYRPGLDRDNDGFACEDD